MLHAHVHAAETARVGNHFRELAEWIIHVEEWPGQHRELSDGRGEVAV